MKSLFREKLIFDSTHENARSLFREKQVFYSLTRVLSESF